MSDKHEILKRYFGYDSFRAGQEKLIDAIISGSDVLGIMPTGAGKSLCYQVPALMAEGMTLVVSPLISLMKDQVNTLVKKGVSAAYINSSLSKAQLERALENMRQGRYKLVYVAPERLVGERFTELCRGLDISMIAVDEAHCVSKWGYSFRESYLLIKDFAEELPRRPVMAAFTATATEAVRLDIAAHLGLRDPVLLVTGFARPNLHFTVRRRMLPMPRVLRIISEHKGQTGIIYCSSRYLVNTVCRRLRLLGKEATRYHAGLKDSERMRNQDDFISGKKPVMVATNAFGMGIDKPDVRYVIHMNMPKDLESYYQEAGRAGRDGLESDCILFYHRLDVETGRFFIREAFPAGAVSLDDFEMFLNDEKQRLADMFRYCKTKDCLQSFMLRYFGEEPTAPCGKCKNCVKAQRAAERAARRSSRFERHGK